MLNATKALEKVNIQRFIELGFANLGESGSTSGLETEWRTYCLGKNIMRIQIKIEKKKYKVEVFVWSSPFTEEQKEKMRSVAESLLMEVEIYNYFARVQNLHRKKGATALAEMLAEYYKTSMQK